MKEERRPRGEDQSVSQRVRISTDPPQSGLIRACVPVGQRRHYSPLVETVRNPLTLTMGGTDRKLFIKTMRSCSEELFKSGQRSRAQSDTLCCAAVDLYGVVGGSIPQVAKAPQGRLPCTAQRVS